MTSIILPRIALGFYDSEKFGLGALPTLLVIITLAFFLIRLAPGGPFDIERPMPPEIAANIEHAYHLDKPLPVQYGYYLLNVLQGDLGPSFKYQDHSVSSLIAEGFPVSLQLGVFVMLLALLIGIPAGMLAALHHNRPLDHAVMAVSMTGITIPIFGRWLAGCVGSERGMKQRCIRPPKSS